MLMDNNHQMNALNRDNTQFQNDLPLDIASLIQIVRGRPVMIDRDLAMLYGVETKRLNEQVKRNIERFPEDFMFQLDTHEFDNWKSQIATSNSVTMGLRKRPFAFTENGVAMLSSVLYSQTAINVNIKIMRTFTGMRHFLTANAQIFQRLNIIEHHQIATDQRVDEIFRRMDAGQKPQQGIFFDGQIFDAYQFVCDLIRSAKEKIVLFDNYIDDTVLTQLDKRMASVSATVFTHNISRQIALDVEKHNRQYPSIEVKVFDKFHDRFLCIDDTVYHIGASLKDLGKKWFAFSKMEIPAEQLLEGVY